MGTAPHGLLTAAILLATKAHDGQVRKGSALPYVTHVLEVMQILVRHGVTEETVLAAAVLHDVIEDGAVGELGIREGFGPEVARLVTVLTKLESLPEEERMPAALRQVREGPAAGRVIKMADRYSNLLDFPVPGWSRAKRERYLDDAEEIARMGREDLPSLSRALFDLAAAHRRRGEGDAPPGAPGTP